MKLIHVGTAALNQTPLDWDANAANIQRAIEISRDRGVRLLCMPEMCITGYGCEDAFLSPAVRRMARRILFELAPHTRGMAVSVGLPVLHEGGLFNACAFLVDGKVLGLVAKQQLAGDGLHYETRWFKAWPTGKIGAAKLDDLELPIGDLVFDLDGIRVAFEICEDAWTAHRPGTSHSERGVDLVLNSSASHFAFGKQTVRRQLVAESSRSLGVGYIYSNLLGNEAGRTIYDGGSLIGSEGKIIAEGKRLSFKPCLVTDAVVDIDILRMQRAQLVGRQNSVGAPNRFVSTPFAFDNAKIDQTMTQTVDWENSPQIEKEEFTRAISLALFDYMRKSASKGYVVSLSGGADSTAVACLVRLMVDLAITELGMETVLRTLGIDATNISNTRELTEILLTTVYQATVNSSDETQQTAQNVAKAIGAKHIELDVDKLRQNYTRLIEQAIGRDLTWENDDIALQNIQARVRAPSAWMLANLEEKILAATSNRSEAALGYATMDGDTCGGISPIAGIDKAFLRNWLIWLEREGPSGVGKIEAVGCANALTPTAELRPPDQSQTDENDLMPYDVLDTIEDEAIGRKRSPVETLQVLMSKFSRHSKHDLKTWIERFFTLFSRNQWKRERYAPAFHVDDKNLDPKTWCRFPILSGGFRRELREINTTNPT